MNPSSTTIERSAESIAAVWAAAWNATDQSLATVLAQSGLPLDWTPAAG